jgi:hypothetical protein
MSFFEEFSSACKNCGEVSSRLFNYMLDNEELREMNVKLREFNGPFGGKHYAFRVEFPKNELLYGVSVSVPPDAMGNRGKKYGEENPKTYETALVGTDENLTYVDELGYSDVCRFEGMNEVVEEVLRLVKKC